MTIYNANNSAGATVHDVETLERLSYVISVDDTKGIVTRALQPVRPDHTGKAVEVYDTRYRSIRPIFGGETKPIMFHCYGKIE